MTRIEELTLKLLHEPLAEPELDELERLLAQDDSDARPHLALLDLDAALRAERQPIEVTESAVARLTATLADRVQRGVVAEITAITQQSGWHRPPLPVPPHRRWRIAFMTAALLLALGVWYGKHTDRGAASVGHVEQASGALEVLTDSGRFEPLEVGAPLRSGQTIRTRGADSHAVLQFADATRLELSPDTLVRLMTGTATGNKVLVTSGLVRANTPSSARHPQTVVATPQLEVRPGEARFVLGVTSPESGRLDLEAGAVAVERSVDGRRFDVAAGSYVVATMEPSDPVIRDLPTLLVQPGRRLDFQHARKINFLGGHAGLAQGPNRLWFWTEPDGEVAFELPFRRKHGSIYSQSNFGGCGGVSADGKTAAVCTNDGVIHIWDVVRRQERVTIDLHTPIPQLLPMALAPDGSWVAMPEPDPNQPPAIRLWNTLSGEELAAIPAAASSIPCLTVSRDGRYLAPMLSKPEGRRAQPPTLLVWDLAMRQPLSFLLDRATTVRAVAFSPDGQLLATSWHDGKVRVWDLTARKLQHTLEVNQLLYCLAFTPDGRRLAGGNSMGQVKLWDLATGEEQLRIQAGSRVTWDLAISTDGTRLAAVAHDAPVTIWGLPAGK
ncbi:MAG: FecR domain-containing protein [Planctomycetia bacterium]|nr:FecR domain-containing protein [Planctomycetia bacterium]